jgi:hypothetical protein
MDAEWHLFVVSHGREACGGIGGTIEMLANKAALQNSYWEELYK